MSEFTGEQKLRIVLESILRNVPKSEQCQKYGITEAEFDSWNHKLVTDGGRIYDEYKPATSVERTPMLTNLKSLGKVGIILSILINLGALCFLGVWLLTDDDVETATAPLTEVEIVEDIPEAYTELESPIVGGGNLPSQDDGEPQEEDLESFIAGFDTPPNDSSLPLESLLADPLQLPNPEVLSPVNPEDLNAEVMLFNKVYQGKHVVYVLDASVYMVENNQSAQRFGKMRSALMDSIINLSTNSYFNLVIYWNLREAAALGRTIIRANQENKKLALDWLSSLDGDSANLKEKRNRFYQKELLFANPLPGIIGPWYGVSTAVSYDPDIIFVLSGNTAAFAPNEVPKSHYSRLGVNPFASPVSKDQNKTVASTVSDLTRQTAFKWLSSIEPLSKLPSNPTEVEEIALKRLGLWGGSTSVNGGMTIPWKKVFEFFLTGLEFNFSEVPKSHFFVYLPEHTAWPHDLSRTVQDFAISSKGSFVVNPDIP
jgi:hypothetical protein